MKNRIILTPLEIQRLYEYSQEHNDNVVLHWCDTSIGAEYWVQTQREMWDNSKNETFITDWENW